MSEKTEFLVKNKMFIARVVYTPGEYFSEGKIYTINCWDMDNIPDHFFDRLIWDGFVKHDGCMNFKYEDSSDCMIHECGLKSIQNTFKIIEWGIEIIFQSIEKKDLSLW